MHASDAFLTSGPRQRTAHVPSQDRRSVTFKMNDSNSTPTTPTTGATARATGEDASPPKKSRTDPANTDLSPQRSAATDLTEDSNLPGANSTSAKRAYQKHMGVKDAAQPLGRKTSVHLSVSAASVARSMSTSSVPSNVLRPSTSSPAMNAVPGRVSEYRSSTGSTSYAYTPQSATGSPSCSTASEVNKQRLAARSRSEIELAKERQKFRDAEQAKLSSGKQSVEPIRQVHRLASSEEELSDNEDSRRRKQKKTDSGKQKKKRIESSSDSDTRSRFSSKNGEWEKRYNGRKRKADDGGDEERRRKQARAAKEQEEERRRRERKEERKREEARKAKEDAKKKEDQEKAREEEKKKKEEAERRMHEEEKERREERKREEARKAKEEAKKKEDQEKAREEEKKKKEEAERRMHEEEKERKRVKAVEEGRKRAEEAILKKAQEDHELKMKERERKKREEEQEKKRKAQEQRMRELKEAALKKKQSTPSTSSSCRAQQGEARQELPIRNETAYFTGPSGRVKEQKRAEAVNYAEGSAKDASRPSSRGKGTIGSQASPHVEPVKENGTGRNTMQCVLCRDHEVFQPMKGHRNKCPFEVPVSNPEFVCCCEAGLKRLIYKAESKKGKFPGTKPQFMAMVQGLFEQIVMERGAMGLELLSPENCYNDNRSGEIRRQIKAHQPSNAASASSESSALINRHPRHRPYQIPPTPERATFEPAPERAVSEENVTDRQLMSPEEVDVGPLKSTADEELLYEREHDERKPFRQLKPDLHPDVDVGEDDDDGEDEFIDVECTDGIFTEDDYGVLWFSTEIPMPKEDVNARRVKMEPVSFGYGDDEQPSTSTAASSEPYQAEEDLPRTSYEVSSLHDVELPSTSSLSSLPHHGDEQSNTSSTVSPQPQAEQAQLQITSEEHQEHLPPSRKEPITETPVLRKKQNELPPNLTRVKREQLEPDEVEPARCSAAPATTMPHAEPAAPLNAPEPQVRTSPTQGAHPLSQNVKQEAAQQDDVATRPCSSRQREPQGPPQAQPRAPFNEDEISVIPSAELEAALCGVPAAFVLELLFQYTDRAAGPQSAHFSDQMRSHESLVQFVRRNFERMKQKKRSSTIREQNQSSYQHTQTLRPQSGRPSSTLSSPPSTSSAAGSGATAPVPVQSPPQQTQNPLQAMQQLSMAGAGDPQHTPRRTLLPMPGQASAQRPPRTSPQTSVAPYTSVQHSVNALMSKNPQQAVMQRQAQPMHQPQGVPAPRPPPPRPQHIPLQRTQQQSVITHTPLGQAPATANIVPQQQDHVLRSLLNQHEQQQQSTQPARTMPVPQSIYGGQAAYNMGTQAAQQQMIAYQNYCRLYNQGPSQSHSGMMQSFHTLGSQHASAQQQQPLPLGRILPGSGGYQYMHDGINRPRPNA